MHTDRWSDEQLLSLEHNDHLRSFQRYLAQVRHTKDKQDFLLSWVAPDENDMILECGSSGGKTCVDLTLRTGCRALGVDFDSEAVKLSEQLRDAHFPELTEKCQFRKDDLAKMAFDKRITKVVMADFTEHIPDPVFEKILSNIKRQLPGSLLYIYTPLRTHLLERMKHRNFIMWKPSGHINVKTEKLLKQFLEHCGWSVLSCRWRGSHIPVFRSIEYVLGHLPVLGPLFRRRIAIIAKPLTEENE
ncbi:MAG: class I SAM-dependent methyltransferase [Planctomycetota bacterium]|jgi:cyclopropane fatty-acyl-phospholipid synthase-like methyltransferase